ncbi:MAG: hypothetical protein ACTSYM_09905, partial [Candidatus Baldrarchaeia archaeon]
MSEDFKSFLWGVGLGEEIAESKARRKAKRKTVSFKKPMLKLENVKVEDNTLIVQLRNLGKNFETI